MVFSKITRVTQIWRIWMRNHLQLEVYQEAPQIKLIRVWLINWGNRFNKVSNWHLPPVVVSVPLGDMEIITVVILYHLQPNISKEITSQATIQVHRTIELLHQVQVLVYNNKIAWWWELHMILSIPRLWIMAKTTKPIVITVVI